MSSIFTTVPLVQSQLLSTMSWYHSCQRTLLDIYETVFPSNTLHHCSSTGRTLEVQELLDNGANVQARDKVTHCGDARHDHPLKVISISWPEKNLS